MYKNWFKILNRLSKNVRKPQATRGDFFDSHCISKFTTFRLSTVENCPRFLWQPSTLIHLDSNRSTTKLLATDFANFFRTKLANILSHLSTEPPAINPRPSTLFSQFQPTTVEEIIHLINTISAKPSLLDPIPTWPLKGLSILTVNILSM